MRDLLSKTFIYFSTVIFGQVVSFFLLPIITRSFDPAIFGEYSLVLSIFNLIGVFGASWIRNVSFRLYFDQNNRENNREFVLSVCFFQFCLVALIVGITIPVIQFSSSLFYSIDILLAAGLSVVLGDFYSLFINFLRAENLTFRFAVSEVLYGAIRFSAVTLGLVSGLGSSGAFLFLCVALAAGVAGFFAFISLRGQLQGKFRVNIEILRETVRLGIVSIPHSAGVWILALSDRLILQYFEGSSTVGIYSLGYSLGNRVIGGLTAATFMMSWPSILNKWREEGDDGATIAIHQALKIFIWITLGPLFFLIIFSEPLTVAFAGPMYAEASRIVPIIAISAWIAGLTTYINRPVELDKKYRLLSSVTMFAATANIVLNFLLIPSLGALGAAWATLTAYGLALGGFVWLTNRQVLNIPWSSLLGVLGIVGLAWLGSSIITDNWWFQSSGFIVIYFVGFLVWFFNQVREG